jgi:hypothetical protein
MRAARSSGYRSTARGRSRRWRRGVLALATAVGMVAMLAGIALAANPATATLSNGAQLTVSIDSPATGTEFVGSAVDVPVAGKASIGVGAQDATIVYVMDFSGSTGGTPSGSTCGTILDCEKAFFVGLNAAAVADGSTDEVAVVKFSDSASTALGLTDPTSPAVNAAITSGSPGGGTNCSAGLTDALSLVNATTNGHTFVVFASDGVCNTGANVTGPAGALGAAGAVVQSIAIGAGSSCTTDGGAGTLNQIAQNGGVCTAVPNPNNLPDIIQNLIGSTLQSLALSVDGNSSAIPNSEIDPDLPQPGAATVTYSTTAQDLAPGAHTICVTAAGSDVLGDSKTAEACVTVQVVQLSAAPATETNELGSDNQHTVTATIAGDPSVVAGRTVSFVVGGQNAGATGTCSPNANCTTNAAGQVSFTYTVPKADSSLGTDEIEVSAQLGTPPAKVSVTVEKIWRDTTPPVLACTPSVNPNGKNVPGGSNEDGFYLLTATDTVTAQSDIVISVNGLGRPDGSPFRSGDTMKYTQASDGSTPVSKKIGGPDSAVAAHIVSPGDATVTATDTSGNTSTVTCLVPKPPK